MSVGDRAEPQRPALESLLPRAVDGVELAGRVRHEHRTSEVLVGLVALFAVKVRRLGLNEVDACAECLRRPVTISGIRGRR
ncbi:MAG: hypothetical protein ACRDZO_25080 [Egibacteraceae bacterium]